MIEPYLFSSAMPMARHTFPEFHNYVKIFMWISVW